MFKQIENLPVRSLVPTSDVLRHLRFNADGLLPAIAQQYDTGEVLMLAWMNREALEETLSTGRACYFSRSRQRLWRKGEESGQIQKVKGVQIDCDGDTLLLRVDQQGPACHTGRSNCFFLQVEGEQTRIATSPMVDPNILYAARPSHTGTPA